MSDGDVTSIIRERLKCIEDQQRVRILYAVESGSRAWGFPSPDSDYDVRFIYCRPRDHYLSIDLDRKPDVIEYPVDDDLDMSGWDVRKALQLFEKSNPALVEWLSSPIRYEERGAFAAKARRLLPDIYRPASGVHHYRRMAMEHHRRWLHRPLVPIKKYFYVLRPLLCAIWIERHQTPPPVPFAQLLPLVRDNPDLLRAIDGLLEQKASTREMGLAPPIHTIDCFVDENVSFTAKSISDTPVPIEAREKPNRLFRWVVDAPWPGA